MSKNNEVYPEKESKLVELKEKLSSLNNIIKTCVAFANGHGGEIVIGVQDQTREIIGVSKKDENIFYESIPNKVFDSVSPLLIPDFLEKNFGDKNVFIIRVHSGGKRPYYVKKEGLSNGVYVRVGPHNRKIPTEEVELLVNTSRGITYDSESTNTPVELIKKSSLLKNIYSRVSINLLEREKILKREANGKLYVSRAATLMFVEKPEEYLPEATVICTLFKGITGRDIVLTREVAGPVPNIIEETLSILDHWLARDFKLNKKGEYKGTTLIPQIALREAIINALIHRKYSITGAVKIAIYDNRVEIFSPGGFPGTISPENIGDGSTHLRNPLLAKFARKLHLIEKLGSGIRTIYDECKKIKIKRPDFFEDGDFVKVVFYFEKEKIVRTDISELILGQFEEHEVLKVEDILNIADVSRNTVTNNFNKLMKRNLVKRMGQGRGVYYKKNDS
ncbi:MAG: putative DNA binding domain-containing protein [Bacteriovoracaceae bacterium]|nr:putative DNA binding domain-containing protein [Bacteriovoracaceae bacterium]